MSLGSEPGLPIHYAGRTDTLIVDDVSFFRELMRDAFSRAGFQPIVEAASGKDALSLFEQNRFPLVLLDIALPDIDGLAVLEAMRPAATTRVIVITAAASRDVVRRAKRLGAVQVFVKPVEPEDVIRFAVQGLVGGDDDHALR